MPWESGPGFAVNTTRGDKMNILINAANTLDPILMEKLAALPETSIYLSLSPEDTLRILQETHPEVLITDGRLTSASFLRRIQAIFPEVEIYLSEDTGTGSGNCSLVRYSLGAGAVLLSREMGRITSGAEKRLDCNNIDMMITTNANNLPPRRRPK
jgi:hypothetical protein